MEKRSPPPQPGTPPFRGSLRRLVLHRTMANSLQVQVREPDEAAELVRLSFDEMAGLSSALHTTHAGIAGRVFKWPGPAAAPVRAIHDRAVAAVYGGLG